MTEQKLKAIKEQDEALNKLLITFINDINKPNLINVNKPKLIGLYGTAGTGKTTTVIKLIQHILNYLTSGDAPNKYKLNKVHKININAITTSHNAKLILENRLVDTPIMRQLNSEYNLNVKCSTIASLLKLKPVINYDTGVMSFDIPENTDKVSSEIVIIDECSQIGVTHFNQLLKVLDAGVIIFLGDMYQTPPVPDKNTTGTTKYALKPNDIKDSPCFDINLIPNQVYLSTPFRYEGVIQDVSRDLCAMIDIVTESNDNDKSNSLKLLNNYYLNQTNQFSFTNDVYKVIDTYQYHHNRNDSVVIIPYRNNTVKHWCNLIRTRLYGDNAPSYVINECVTINTQQLINAEPIPNTQPLKLHNQRRCIIIDEPIKQYALLLSYNKVITDKSSKPNKTYNVYVVEVIDIFDSIDKANEAMIKHNNTYKNNDSSNYTIIDSYNLVLADVHDIENTETAVINTICVNNSNVNIYNSLISNFSNSIVKLNSIVDSKGKFTINNSSNTCTKHQLISKLWSDYFRVIEGFVKLNYSYAANTYIVQGDTYDHVIVDINDISAVKPITVKQMYQSINTAITRASKSVLIYH